MVSNYRIISLTCITSKVIEKIMYQQIIDHIQINNYISVAGVTMTLFCTHGRVSGPNSLLDHEVIAPCGYSVPCQF